MLKRFLWCVLRWFPGIAKHGNNREINPRFSDAQVVEVSIRNLPAQVTYKKDVSERYQPIRELQNELPDPYHV